MELTTIEAGRVHEVLIGDTWMPITIGTYWQHHDPSAVNLTYRPNPNRPGQVGWREMGKGATVIVQMCAVHGFKFDTLRGKLEGG